MRFDRLEPLKEPSGYPMVIVPIVAPQDQLPGHLYIPRIRSAAREISLRMALGMTGMMIDQ